MKDLYHTIKESSSGQFKDRGSRFIALAYPVRDESEIKDILAGLRKEYHDARHHCYAWKIGPGEDRYRINDGGEPSGSAGRPIYGQFLSRDLSDILVVVIRYFGGTLLGVSGLINAYRSATSDALDQALILERKVERLLELRFAYSQMNSVMKLVKDLGLGIQSQDFDMECHLVLRVWTRQMPSLVEKLSRLESCRVEESPE